MMLRALRKNGTLLLALLACLLLAACAGRARPNTVAAPDIPASFDMTVLADKDGQFDLDGATLAPEDLIGHLNYRKESGTPVHTLLLKRGEKQKVTDRHIGQIFRVHAELKIRTFVQEKDGGEISEIRAGSETQ
jgi:hypothetical protein